MRFLLTAVNSKYIHSNPAIYSLRAYAQKTGIPEGGEVVLAEYTINEQVEDIVQQIYRKKPDVIGFSCYIWNITYVRLLVQDLAALLPEVHIWLGGPEASYDAGRLLRELPAVTGIMTGEGERSFAALVSYYCGKGRLEDIPGLVCRNQGDTGACIPVDLSQVPFWYEDLRDFENRIVYYESSRGCPYRCSYCLSSIDKQVRFRDMELVRKELDFFLAHKVPQVKFIDRTFNVRPSRSLEIWTYLADHDNGVTNFHFEISADLLTEEEFAVFARMRPGLIQLEIGVQTTNQKTMNAICRHASFERIAASVRRVHSLRRIHQHLDLIAGLPYEDYNSFRHSFDDVYGLHPDQLQLGFLKVLKGSHMYDAAEEYGIVYSKRPPYEVLFTRWLSFGELMQLKEIEDVVEIYYNSGQFQTSMAYLETLYARPFFLYEDLAAFCSFREDSRVAHSRLQQYERLLCFVKQLDGVQDRYRKPDLTVFVSALVHDCYLRENCKSRPSFAGTEGVVDREFARLFYQREAAAPEYLYGYEGYQSRQLANMTHLEQYPVDVLAIEKGQIIRKPVIVLYDYKNRDVFCRNGMCMSVGQQGGYES